MKIFKKHVGYLCKIKLNRRTVIGIITMLNDMGDGCKVFVPSLQQTIEFVSTDQIITINKLPNLSHQLFWHKDGTNFFNI